MANYSKELSVAKEAVYEAADIIQSHQNNQDFKVNFKGLNDMVTNADVESEQKIMEMILDQFPDDQFIAEESEQEVIDLDGRNWIIDPIDGTTNFVHGFPVYCVSIGFWEDGEPKVGVVLEVNSDELYWAVEGEGAFLNEDKIQVSALDDPQHALVGTGFPYDKKDSMGDYLQLFRYLLHNTQSIRRPGAAAYDLCCVAAGRFDGFYEHPLHPWDVGAAALIVREAGGVVSDWEGGDSWLTSTYMVAGNKTVHAYILDAIERKYLQTD